MDRYVESVDDKPQRDVMRHARQLGNDIQIDAQRHTAPKKPA